MGNTKLLMPVIFVGKDCPLCHKVTEITRGKVWQNIPSNIN